MYILSKKFIKKYKTDIYALSIIIGFIVIIGIIIIVMNVTRRKKIEGFNNYKLMNINNRITKYIKSFKSTPHSPMSKQLYDSSINNNVYIIEQERSNYNELDNYTIKSNIGSILYNTEGLWNLNDSKFQLVSTGGQAISVQELGPSRYFFSIGNINISFYYKKVKIFGKILIDDGDNNISIYMKRNDKYINFYTDTNKRVAYAKMDNTISRDTKLYTSRLTIIPDYNKYNNIFIIIYIVYLQIYKDQHNTEFL